MCLMVRSANSGTLVFLWLAHLFSLPWHWLWPSTAGPAVLHRTLSPSSTRTVIPSLSVFFFFFGLLPVGTDIILSTTKEILTMTEKEDSQRVVDSR